MSRKLTRLFHEQGGRCWYCGGDTYLPGGGETKADAKARFGLPVGSRNKLFRRHYATIEHLHRKCEGGTKANSNIVMACQGCNVRRGEASVEQHKAAVLSAVASGVHWTVHHA